MRRLLTRPWLFAFLVGACADDSGATDAGANAGADAGALLHADAGASRYALVGEDVVLDGSASTGAVSYAWAYGDGRSRAPIADPIARVRYDAPGRYRVVLTVRDTAGARRTDGVLVTVTRALVHEPVASGPMLWLAKEHRLAVVSEDADELVVFGAAAGEFAEAFRRATEDGPRSVAVWRGFLAVVCQRAGVVELHPRSGSGTTIAIALPRASRPFAAVAAGDALYVTLQATGQVARIEQTAAGPEVTEISDVVPDARGIGVLPDGRLAVSRWRSPDARGEIAVLDPSTGSIEMWSLAYDDTPPSDTETGGVPSYLDQIVVSPTAELVAFPSLQAAIGQGLVRNGMAMTHETTVRAIVSFVDPTTGIEDVSGRRLFDDRGFASAATFSRRGDYLYVAMRGSRTVERLDILRGSQAGAILGVGYAPDALAISSDDRTLFVHVPLSREVVMYDVGDHSALPVEIARLPVVVSEPLPPEVLRGKQLFNDSADVRITRSGYIACAHCHLDGQTDLRTWDFTDRGEGLRNTIDLRGRAGTGHGPIHWSANFDEVQDFEHDIRGPFGGRGLMPDEDFMSGGRDTSLGTPKAGISRDLDALAAYVTSLDLTLASPYVEPDGSLSPAAERGRLVFERVNVACTTCHFGVAFTDSRFDAAGVPVLHDVGTITATSGMRLGAPLTGIDTPTLRGIWATAPYLHDGSAPTLRDVLTTRNSADEHGTTSTLSPTELDDLLAYLLAL